MKITRSLLRSGAFFRRRRARPFFSRRRGAAAADNPEPSSPKVTCIGQVRVKSQKRVKQCRRRISGGEASFRSGEPSLRRSQRDQRWVHLPSISVLLRAVGHEFCCFFRCRCRCSCFERREKVMRRGGSGNGSGSGGELFGRWLVAVHGGGGSRREIEGEEEVEVEEMGNSRRHVFDDIEVIGDRIEVKGGRVVNGGVSICIPPKNALLLMRCRSDPLKMAAIANRISSDALRYDNGAADEEEEASDDGRKIFVVQVFEKEKKEVDAIVEENDDFICSQEKVVEEEAEEKEEEEEEEEEEVESNMSSFEALLEQENTENYRDSTIQEEGEEEEEANAEEPMKSDAEDNVNSTTAAVEEKVHQENIAVTLPENQETPAAEEVLPECLLLMMREPKLSMEVSKETWVCATDFIRLLPERPRRAAAKAAAAAAPADQVKRRAAVEKSKSRVPPLPNKRNEIQPARSSCSLPAAAAGRERKRVSGGACEPLALTRCKSEPMSTAAAKLMPEPGCWKENAGMKLEPHRQAAVGVGAAEVGV